MSDSPHFSETDDVEINLDALTPDTAEEKDDEGRLVAAFDVANRKQRTVMRGGSVTLLP